MANYIVNTIPKKLTEEEILENLNAYALDQSNYFSDNEHIAQWIHDEVLNEPLTEEKLRTLILESRSDRANHKLWVLGARTEEEVRLEVANLDNIERYQNYLSNLYDYLVALRKKNSELEG